MGGAIHILLVIAIIALGVDLFRDERYLRDLDSSRRRWGIVKGDVRPVQGDRNRRKEL
jgi:hypothetical protein